MLFLVTITSNYLSSKTEKAFNPKAKFKLGEKNLRSQYMTHLKQKNYKGTVREISSWQ